jgi:hypothetical protein
VQLTTTPSLPPPTTLFDKSVKLNLLVGRILVPVKTEFDKYEIYLFEEKYGEPRFHFGRKYRGDRRYKDFQFSISLTKTFDDLGKTRVLESSTGYKSFNGFESDEEILRDWLKENINNLKSDWNYLNKRKLNEKDKKI